MTVRGAAEEEVVVLTSRVILTASLSLAAWVGGGALLLTAVILRVPEASLTFTQGDHHDHPSHIHLIVAVVVPTDQANVTVVVTVAVSLTLHTHPDIILDAAMITTAASVNGYFVIMSQDIPDSPHLQTVHNTHVCHDGDCGFSWIRIL